MENDLQRVIMKALGDQMQILQVDNRSHVLNPNIHPFNSIGKVMTSVQVQIKGNKQVITAFGTGSILSNNIVITAAHVLYFSKQNKVATDIHFIPACQKNLSKSKYFKGIKVKEFHINKNFFRQQNTLSSRYDIAILILQENDLIKPDQYLKIKWDYEFFSYQLNPIMIAGYSQDKQQKNHDEIQNNNKLYFEERVAYKQVDTFIHYHHTTSGGNSGGPVLFKQSNDIYRLIGIHKASTAGSNYGLLVNDLCSTKNTLSEMIQQHNLLPSLSSIYSPSYKKLLEENNNLKSMLEKKNIQTEIYQKQFSNMNATINLLENNIKILQHKLSTGQFILLQKMKTLLNNLENIQKESVAISLNKTAQLNGSKAFIAKSDSFKNVTQLMFFNEKIGLDGFKVFTSRAQTFRNINKFIFRNCCIQSSGFVNFVGEAKHFQNLLIIDFSNNKIGDQGLKAFAVKITGFKNLSKIYFSNNQISDKGFKFFVEQGENLKNLNQIDFSDNRITNDGFKCFAFQVINFHSLKFINLSRNQVQQQLITKFQAKYKFQFKIQLFSPDITTENVLFKQMFQILKLNPKSLPNNVQNKPLVQPKLNAVKNLDESKKIQQKIIKQKQSSKQVLKDQSRKRLDNSHFYAIQNGVYVVYKYQQIIMRGGEAQNFIRGQFGIKI